MEGHVRVSESDVRGVKKGKERGCRWGRQMGRRIGGDRRGRRRGDLQNSKEYFRNRNTTKTYKFRPRGRQEANKMSQN